MSPEAAALAAIRAWNFSQKRSTSSSGPSTNWKRLAAQAFAYTPGWTEPSPLLLGAGLVMLSGPQTVSVLGEGLGYGLVRGEFSTQPVQLPGELGDASGPFPVRGVEVGPVAHRRELGAELL